MAHTHDVYDMENHFEINGSSRFIKETSETKLVVVQGDHKSEVLTFKMPRYIDGHDMTLCNKIRIHYINLDTKTNNKSADVYEVTDLTLCEECEDVLTFTWVIEAPATKYSGTLSFLVKFECTEGENVLYQWNTAKYVSVNVLDGIDNSEEFVEKYSNVLEEWYNELTKGADSIEELNQQAIAEIELAKEDAKEDIQGKADATMAEMNQFSSNAYNSFKNDVNEKAARTLEMIPEDYQTLSVQITPIENEIGIIHNGLIMSHTEYDISVLPNSKYKFVFTNTLAEEKVIKIRPRKSDLSAYDEINISLLPCEKTEYELETDENVNYIRLGENASEFNYYVAIFEQSKRIVNKEELEQVKEEINTDVDNKLNITNALVSEVEKCIIGNQCYFIHEKTSPDYIYSKYLFYVPLDKYVEGDTIEIYIPTQADETYNTYFCNEEKQTALEVEVTFVDGYTKVVYPKHSVVYSYIRLKASTESDVCCTVSKRKGVYEIIDSDEHQNISNYFADNTGLTDVAPLINKIIANRSTRLFFPSGKYLLKTPIYHNGKNFSIICDKDVEFIVNSSPIFTTIKLAGAGIEPYSLGSFEINGGKWTRTKEFVETSDQRDTGFQVTKLGRVTIKDADFDVLVQSNHLFDISGSKNVVIEGCKFSGTYFNSTQKPTDENGNFEMLQIDIASGIDHTICVESGHNECAKHIYIRNNIFMPKGNANEYMYRPIGIHFAGTKTDNTVDYYEDVTIEHNEFYNVLGRAIEISCSKNVSIIGNVFQQNTEVIDSIIKCGDVRWENTSSWARFNNVPDIERYNCINVNISDNLLNCTADSNKKFIEVFERSDESDMYVDTIGNRLSKMGKNITITGNTSNLPILVKNVHILEIRKNDVPSTELDNNTLVYSD